MRIQIAQIAPPLLSARSEAFLHDSSILLTVRGTVNVHMTKPWIPKFLSVAIRVPKPGGDRTPSPTRNQRFFDFPIGYAEDGTPWYFPSREWWIAHAKASHPPDGTGCDVDVHTKFLSSEGSVHEFDYATIFSDGTMQILGRGDFVDECLWWSRAFGARGEKP